MVQHHPQGSGDYIGNYLATIPEPVAALLVVGGVVGAYFIVRSVFIGSGRAGAVAFLLCGLVFFATGVVGVFFYYFPDRIPYPSRGTPDIASALPKGVGMAAGGLASLKLSWDAYRARKPIRWERLLFWKNAGGRF